MQVTVSDGGDSVEMQGGSEEITQSWRGFHHPTCY